MAKRWTELVLLASLLLATAALVHAMPDVDDGTDDSSSLSDAAAGAHSAIVPLRHSTRASRAIYAAPLDRKSPPLLIRATSAFRQLDDVSAPPAHLRSGPASVSERGPPAFARI